MSTPRLDRPTDTAAALTALRSLVDDVAALVAAVDEDTWTAASACPERIERLAAFLGRQP